MAVVEVRDAPGTTFINRCCWVRDTGREREVWLNYALLLRYPKEDKVSQRFAVGCLALAKAGSKTAIAEAFGYHRNYVARLAARLEKEGAQGMLGGRVPWSTPRPALPGRSPCPTPETRGFFIRWWILANQ